MNSRAVVRSAIRRLRRQGLSLAQIADQSGISFAMIWRYELGLTAVGQRNAPKLAPVLGVPVEHLLYGVPRKKKEPTQ